ncbi:MAG TPA: penicillin-binding transpeptidase domain-containing protein [Phototrophicaceae bacterium]|nr:penicillin-binding transpeptidase domain-containing protein [Phototrophicaceae bacterium]
MFQRLLLTVLILIALAACSPAAPQTRVEALPTLAVLNPPTPQPLENAERVARDFLEAWRAADFPAMYALTAFSTQEATPLEAFTALYQSSQTEMTLTALEYTGLTLYREREVAVFVYDATFSTNLLGTFTDSGRELRLVLDERAADWRVAWSPENIFAQMSDSARLQLEVNAPSRANIYDRNGEILADQNGRAVIVSAVKQAIPAWDSCVILLAPLLGKTAEALQKIYDESAPDWLMQLGTMEAAAYEPNHTQLETICGAQFTSHPTRRYQNGTLAPYIIGNVGYPDEAAVSAAREAGFDQDSILGKSGIEQSWDATLRGQPGGRLMIVSQGGGMVREIVRSPSKPSESVWLTLDTNLQAKTSEIIAKAYANNPWSATSKGAAAVVMNVKTGEILAMVSYPTYDGNAFNPFPTMGRAEAAKIIAAVQADKRRPQLNRATQGLYPLGSVMKTASAAAVADSGVYTLDQKYTCVGTWTRDIVRTDWNSGHGTLTLPQSLTHSCNPYYYEVGYQMFQAQPGVLPQYMLKVGFGSPTGLRDLTEDSGFIPTPDWKRENLGMEWNFSDEVNIAIGQGEVQVTPLQVVRWIGAIANNGTLLRPQLVQKVGILGEAPSYTLEPDPMVKLEIKPEVFDMLHEGMCAVVQSQQGTAEFQFKHSRLQSIGICGKTGTAQDGSSAEAVSHAWFAAYGPEEDPEIAVVVLVENAGQGSYEAAPIARDILEVYFFGEDLPQ